MTSMLLPHFKVSRHRNGVAVFCWQPWPRLRCPGIGPSWLKLIRHAKLEEECNNAVVGPQGVICAWLVTDVGADVRTAVTRPLTETVCKVATDHKGRDARIGAGQRVDHAKTDFVLRQARTVRKPRHGKNTGTALDRTLVTKRRCTRQAWDRKAALPHREQLEARLDHDAVPLRVSTWM